MKPFEKCSDESLRMILSSDTGDGSAERLAVHVESCEHCQQRMEQLAAEQQLWSDAKEFLSSGESSRDSTHDSNRMPVAAQARWSRKFLPRQVALSDSVIRQMLAPPSHPEMLGRVGRYEVERIIGIGGMGVVFKAFDTELNRPVAVKVLALHLAGHGAARKRFAREARAAAAIVHEHVVAIHNVETEHECPYLVMQFVAGESLQQRIDRQGAFELPEILRIAMQTAAGLAAAHAQGLVHRDVKPSNILLEQNLERALLSDFGLVRANDDASLTHTGYHPGTPQYMSPEQARGESVDARSDLFSLGSVIYAMCTGRPPFRAETAYGILRRITDDAPRSIREVNPSVPNWLEGFVFKLLSKSPDDRFESAEVVRSLLEACLAHVQQPTVAALPTLVNGLCHTASKRPTWSRKSIGVALSLLMLSAASLYGLSIFWNRYHREPFGNSSRTNAIQTISIPTDPESRPSAATSQSLDWDAAVGPIDRIHEQLVDLEREFIPGKW